MLFPATFDNFVSFFDVLGPFCLPRLQFRHAKSWPSLTSLRCVMIIALDQYWYLDLELDLPSTDIDLALSTGLLRGSQLGWNLPSVVSLNCVECCLSVPGRCLLHQLGQERQPQIYGDHQPQLNIRSEQIGSDWTVFRGRGGGWEWGGDRCDGTGTHVWSHSLWISVPGCKSTTTQHGMQLTEPCKPSF